ncbi:hypothetical protein QN277_009366 [Acacia crassicarpa]|uniref:Uncharacterized protein n=1 Tax=Acacia crassicarpa TaxID=499986 RepID=A0AAE1ITM6_9FABA|nr:hypothetical protein QN277_009366 [Acacia crassicarpa]
MEDVEEKPSLSKSPPKSAEEISLPDLPKENNEEINLVDNRSYAKSPISSLHDGKGESRTYLPVTESSKLATPQDACEGQTVGKDGFLPVDDSASTSNSDGKEESRTHMPHASDGQTVFLKLIQLQSQSVPKLWRYVCSSVLPLFAVVITVLPWKSCQDEGWEGKSVGEGYFGIFHNVFNSVSVI